MSEQQSKSRGRGQIWVVGQFVLGFALLASGYLWHEIFWWPSLIGVGLGGLVGLIGVTRLGTSLSVFPRPKDDAVFVGDGLYRWVRHPIYSGLLLAGLCWAITWTSLPAFGVWVVFVVWMDRKAAQEEIWLTARYSNYPIYCQTVRKFVPFVY